jgi:hypothetical protein
MPLIMKYAAYYNELRTHRSLNKDAPIYRAIQHVGCIVSAPVLGGLHHHIAESDFRHTQAQAVAAVLLASAMGNTATASEPRTRLRSRRNSAHC